MTTQDQALVTATARARVDVLLASFARLTGRPLAADARALWHLPAAVVAHDTKATPEFFYANAAALAQFRMAAADFLGMPSYRSAEAQHRDERAAMFTRLQAADVVTDYAGVRITADGTRFCIRDAVIWNLRDAAGVLHGQAAWFEHADPL
ncbi:MAG: MEKHLA domain-containing protein [Erythrobacter sp.]|nr:MEKHLA domain-containing protein [Erythrobacter sp.]